MHQYPDFYISSSYIKTNLSNNNQEKIEIFALQPVNTLIIKIIITQPVHSPRTFTSLKGNQICIYDLYVAQRHF